MTLLQSQVDQLDLLAKAVVFDAFTVGSAKEAFTMMGHGEMREDALTVRGKYDLQKNVPAYDLHRHNVLSCTTSQDETRS